MTANQKYAEFLKKLEPEPPIHCDLKVGDTVTFTNEYGVSFPGLKVIGFAKDDDFYGRFIYLETSSYWFPNHPAEVTLESRPLDQA